MGGTRFDAWGFEGGSVPPNFSASGPVDIICWVSRTVEALSQFQTDLMLRRVRVPAETRHRNVNQSPETTMSAPYTDIVINRDGAVFEIMLGFAAAS